MGYTGIAYRINSGDTLWDIAAQQLGDPYAWPRLFAFNNQDDVVTAGARRIIDPDLIYAGEIMMLPIVKSQANTIAPSANRAPQTPGSLKEKIPTIKMPLSIAYDLKGDALVLDYGTFIARVRQKGRILLNLGSPLPLTKVINGGIEASSKTQANMAFGTLMSKNTVSLDPATKSIKFSNKLISSSNRGGPKTAVGIEVSSTSGMPVLKAEIIYDELKGTIGNDAFVALNYKIEIEIEPRAPKPHFQPIPIRTPVSSPTRVPQTDWGQVAREASGWALLAAGVITVVYGASVVFSGGASGVAAPGYASLMTVILVGGTAMTVTVQN